MSSANKDGLLQVHLDKYLPLWCCSQHSPLPPLRNVESVQLLTVEQATGSNQSGNEASASGVRCAGLGVAPVGQLATGDGDGGNMVVGLLKTNDCGEMTLEDSTAKVKCEVRRDSSSCHSNSVKLFCAVTGNTVVLGVLTYYDIETVHTVCLWSEKGGGHYHCDLVRFNSLSRTVITSSS